MSRQPTEEQFLKDVAAHQMRIRRNDGLYRHLEFRGPHGWRHWFEVVTWPMGLIIRGDMGDWAFSRVEDMFQFFRGTEINPHYWHEKLLADHGGRDDAKPFSIDALKAQVVYHIDGDYDAEELAPEQRAEILAELEEEVFRSFGDSEERPALDALFSFKMHGVTFDPMDGPWGQDWSYHYIWCCYAIQWAIRQYDSGQARP